MRKTLKALILAALLSSLFIAYAYAEETIQINSLIDDTESYDNQTVTIEGEAIGEVLERGDYSWVNVNDGTNAIGVWMKTAEAKNIQYFGGYKHIGDTVRITGVFSKDCTEHGGDVDIHCASITIVKAGSTNTEKISDTKIITAAVLLLAAALMALIYKRSIKKLKD
ncbi:MAG: hypothetical protein QMB62_11500 [Oscillospiraceae bacterium]